MFPDFEKILIRLFILTVIAAVFVCTVIFTIIWSFLR